MNRQEVAEVAAETPETVLYKLTDQEGYTRRGLPHETLWSEGLVVSATEEGTKLCTPRLSMPTEPSA